MMATSQHEIRGRLRVFSLLKSFANAEASSLPRIELTADLLQLTPEQFALFIYYLLRPVEEGGKGLAAATARRYKRYLSSELTDVLGPEGYQQWNPETQEGNPLKSDECVPTQS